MSDKITDDDGRVQVPLRMFDGNIDALLNNHLCVEAISFVRDPRSPNGVILRVHGVNYEKAKEIGFKTDKAFRLTD